MRYAESVQYLNSFLNFEHMHPEPAHRRWNLDRMRKLVALFSHPEKNFFPVLIAGTKGKGSTGYFLESILNASGIAVGFYTSPHLHDPRERIRIGGKWIPKALWARLLTRMRRRLESVSTSGNGPFTYFEIMTLLAMLAFKEAEVRLGIFEVGMGGRLDATNVLDAPLSLITPVHLDHEQFLGRTVARITREKAAILRFGCHAVVSPQAPEANKVIQKRSRNQKAYRHAIYPMNGAPLGLAGDIQKMNAGAAKKAALLLRSRFGFYISDAAVLKGLVQRQWPGRYEKIEGKPSYVLDVAHNPAAISALVRNLKKDSIHQNSVLLFGVAKDKKSDRILRALGTFFSRAVLTQTPSARSRPAADLMSQARRYFDQAWPATDPAQALALARKLAGPNATVVVTGSFYLVGAVRGLIL